MSSEPLGHPPVTHGPAPPHTGVLLVQYSIVSTLIYDFMLVSLLLYLARFTLAQELSEAFAFAIPVGDDASAALLELRQWLNRTLPPGEQAVTCLRGSNKKRHT